MVGRPKIPRKTCCVTKCTCLTPDNVSNLMESVQLMSDEVEAINLCDKQKKKQSEAAKEMNVSQPTLARILSSAHEKVAKAIINGNKLKIG